MYRIVIGCLLLVIASGSMAAQERQSLDAIRERVERFVSELDAGRGRLERVEVDRLDQRLRLAACGEPLTAELPNGRADAERLVVRVRCPGPEPWKVYVPTRVVRSVEVIVTRRPLPRGSSITADDLQRVRRESGALRGQYYTDREDLVGLQTNRALAAGAVVAARHLTRPTLVRRGDELLLEARNQTVRVSMKARALENGSRGERIRVRNLSSRRELQAEVVGRGRAMVVF